MKIRYSELRDLRKLMIIFDQARSFMQDQGNANQWINGYPSESFIMEEINNKHCYVCENKDGEIIATFCFYIGADPTYQVIEEGEWLSDDPYGVIHRLASNGIEKGIAQKCFDWCFAQCSNIRVDTHHDNIVMQNILRKYGFKECGIIYTHNGTPRIAYQKYI